MFPKANELTDARAAFTSLQLNSFNGFGKITVESLQKIAALNLATAKTFAENFQNTMRAALQVKTPAELLALGSSQREANKASVSAYGSQFSNILSSTREELTSAVQASASRQKETLSDLADSAQSAAAPFAANVAQATAKVADAVTDEENQIAKDIIASEKTMEEEGGYIGTPGRPPIF
ncbi:MAG: phasin family protein [Pseudomonadota bacterium]